MEPTAEDDNQAKDLKLILSKVRKTHQELELKKNTNLREAQPTIEDDK